MQRRPCTETALQSRVHSACGVMLPCHDNPNKVGIVTEAATPAPLYSGILVFSGLFCMRSAIPSSSFEPGLIWSQLLVLLTLCAWKSSRLCWWLALHHQAILAYLCRFESITPQEQSHCNPQFQSGDHAILLPDLVPAMLCQQF